MLHFTVDDAQALSGCVKCCCESMSLKPGTIERLVVGYAPWAMPIGHLHCEPSFTIEAMQTCPVPAGGNLPPAPLGELRFPTPISTPLIVDMNQYVNDPEDADLVFKTLPLYGPMHGKLELKDVSWITYTPIQNYKGPDRFFLSMSDGVNSPVVFEVMVGVGVSTDDILATPHVSIDPNGVQIDQRYFSVSFPVKISPAAQVCEVWRLTVLQGALDCECVCYARSDCFDIKVVKC